MSNAEWVNRTSYNTGLRSPGSGRNASLPTENGEIIQAVVIKTFQDPSLLNKKEVYEIYKLMNSEDRNFLCDSDNNKELPPNSDFFLKIPRNSILVRNIKDCKNTEFNNIAYPFFSSHLMFPIKVGELVWCFKIGNMYYWMSRVHGSDSYEDVNYTHENRKKYPAQFIRFTPEEGFAPNFSNFRDSDNEIITFQFKNESDEPFDDLLNSSNQKNNIFEPIPRITTRPGDLVLQGSNNATILLSTQRGYGKKQRPVKEKNNSEISNNEQLKASGAIDIVVGRGRKKPQKNNEHDESSTQAREILNSRNNLETNKNPLYYESSNEINKNRSHKNDKFCGNVSMDVPEGDPDFVDDAARIYVSMKMDADEILGLNEYYPDKVIQPGDNNDGINLAKSKESSTVLLRSDDIRIVARKDDERSINGSIRIVKEGIKNDLNGNGSAIIMLQPDGTIIIDGPKILIGGDQLISDNGQGNQVSIGLNATEPLVLGNELKKLLENFMDETMNALKNHQHTGGTGPVNPAGSPSEPTYAVALKPHIDKMENIKSQLNNFLSQIGKTR
jgi:hypothetical protein